MAQATTNVADQPRSRTVEGFAAFWANPDLAVLPAALAQDVVGHFPGDPAPVRGRDAYVARIGQFLEQLPGVRLEAPSMPPTASSTSFAGSPAQPGGTAR